MRVALLLLACLLALLHTVPVRAAVSIRVGAGDCAALGSDIQAAINVAGPPPAITDILIQRNGTYHAQQLDINGKNIRLIGGYANCSQATPDATRTVINGAGGGSNSVITIRGTTGLIGLHNLDITGGDQETSVGNHGGGIDVSGGPHSLVHLENVRIQQSRAGLGGGLSVRSSSLSSQAAVRVVLAKNNLIDGNRATHGGGGIYCQDSTIEIVGINNAVYGNAAGLTVPSAFDVAPGGGVRIENCKMLLASRSPFFDTIANNTAAGSGGGISITGTLAKLDMYNLTPDAPTTIARNTAAGDGGGIDIASSARVLAVDSIIDSNTSRGEGGGVSVFDDGSGNDNPSTLVMQGTLNGAPAGAVKCAPAHDCNRISYNVARTVAGTDVHGAALRLVSTSGNARARLYGTRLDHNAGRSLVYLNAHLNSDILLDGTLIDSNTVSADLMHRPSHAVFSIENSTVVANTIGAAVVRSSEDFFGLRRSLIWQPGRPLIGLAGGALAPGSVTYVLAGDLANAPASSTNAVVTAAQLGFVDAAAGNYRLAAGSRGIDYASRAGAHTRDGFSRAVDIPLDGDEHGDQDVGAYEKQAADGYNRPPAIEVAGPIAMSEDASVFLQGFSLSDPDGDIAGELAITVPPDFGGVAAFYFTPLSTRQPAPNRVVIEGPLSRITSDTASLLGGTQYFSTRDFFGQVPIHLEVRDLGNTGIGGNKFAATTLTVDVLPVNDAPTVQIPDIPRTTSDVDAQIVDLAQTSSISVGPSNEAGQSVQSFVLLSTQDSQGVFSAAPTLGGDGNRELKFQLNGTPGVAILSARVIDSGGVENGGVDHSAPATFHIRVSVGGLGLFSDGFEDAP